MAVSFDPAARLIVCSTGTTMVDMDDVYSRWKDWVIAGDNAKYEPAFRTVGGDPTTGGNRIATYFFLLNGWKLRPQEANHTLIVTGILLVDGGGDPYASTVGTYNVRIVATVPLQAEAVIVETGVSGLTPSESAALTALGIKTDELHRIHGLKAGDPMTVTPTSRVAGSIIQTISGDGVASSTVTRV